MGYLHSLRLCNTWVSPEVFFVLSQIFDEYPPSVAWLVVIDYSPVLHELGLSMVAVRRADVNIKFLRDFIDGSTDVFTLICIFNFQVPLRLTRISSNINIPRHTTYYSSNNLIHCMMQGHSSNLRCCKYEYMNELDK